MVAESYTNFATTTLNGAITSGATSMVVATGQGALFPTSNFLVTIDTEVLLITSRATDTFTIGTRGFDSTTATSHANAATVQQCPTAYTLRHLWQNVPDTFVPDVPPVQQGTTPTSYDNEFENQGSWSLYPTSLPSGATFSVGTDLQSALVLHRGTSDSTLYTAYVPFTQTAPFQVTCKLSHAVNVSNNGTGNAEVHFFVSDQTNPTASSDSGNRVRLDAIVSCPNQATNWESHTIISNNAVSVRMLVDVSGSGSEQGPAVPLSLGMPLYLRISCSSSHTYNCYIGDGLTFTGLSGYTTSFSPQSLGFNFYASPATGGSILQTAVIDWVRVDTGSFNTTWGP